MLACALASGPPASPALAQPAPSARQATIDEVYAAMFAALEAGVFARARNLCDQVILWEPANPIHPYNLACIEARAGPHRLEFAIAALARAVDLGFADATHVRGDPDLASLHRDPRFGALLSRMDAARARLPAPVLSSARASPAPPVGLFVATPASPGPGSAVPERSVWFFAPDGTVVLDPVDGLAVPAAAAPPSQRRAKASLVDDLLVVTWSDGTRLQAKMVPFAGGFHWQAWQFRPVAPPPAPAQLAGRYTRSAAFSLRAQAPDAPAALTLAPDGRAEWIATDRRAHLGRWHLSDHTLSLIAADGTTLRWLCFTFQPEPARDAPPQLCLGGFLYEPQP